MTLTEISNIRLMSQQIEATKFEAAKDIVKWMGAMQAQDYAMSKWALGARLPHSTDQIIDNAISKGEIIRTHLLRPTWHLVSAEDVYWMLELSVPQIKTQSKSRLKELELSDALLNKCNTIIEKALFGNNHLTRDELAVLFQKDKILTNENRLSYIMFQAELEGIICSGVIKENRQTYALLEERTVKTNKLSREEALAKLAHAYFSSHCPATLQDFTWWSGLSARDARNALEMVKPHFISEAIDSEVYWLTDSFSMPKKETPSVHLLPAFDEFIISYKNRTASLLLEDHKKAVSNNGIFRPIILVNGQVVGLWKRTIKKEALIIELDFFQDQKESTKKIIAERMETFGSFLNKKIKSTV